MYRLTLCGSTRFREQYVDFNRALSKIGCTIYTVAFFSHDEELDPLVKETLDLVHLDKISNSQGVVIIEGNRNQSEEEIYIGDSTRREKAWASMTGKLIFSSHKYGHKSERLVARLEAMAEGKTYSGKTYLTPKFVGEGEPTHNPIYGVQKNG